LSKGEADIQHNEKPRRATGGVFRFDAADETVIAVAGEMGAASGRE
jgi:hypothetical protein